VSRISILPDTLINKIAAGEVIERPASIIRELTDNSIDSGATRIEIEIEHGGKRYIKVSDNGSGMERDDALICFERHATSKIHSEDDLFHLSTLGFRGEALSALSSVSRVILTTATSGLDTGTRVEVMPNNRKDVREAPPVQGTTVESRDIFFNTPARRKFLKSTPTELSHCIETVIQKAFAYPGVSFTLKHDGSEVMNIPVSGSLRERFTAIYGKDFTDEFFEVKGEGGGIRIYGFASHTDFTRSTRSHQFIFINRRPVKNPTVNHAVYNVYRGLISGGRHPAYFLFLEIDPQRVDVNVHPAKREVRFERPDEVHNLVESAVYVSLDSENTRTAHVREVSEGVRSNAPGYGLKLPPQQSVHESAAIFSQDEQADFISSGLVPAVSTFFHIGDSFFATVTEKGLLIIDQHAAHERILYERFLKRTSIEPEPLVLPLRVEIPVREYTVLLQQKDFLREFGLDIDDFGANNIIIRSMPGELGKDNIRELMIDMASGLIEEETSGIRSDLRSENLIRNIAARLACHRSVRGSELLNDEEMTMMISDLEKCDEPEKCPHGRPTRVLYSLEDLRKIFKRT
jgi:DNA mismatch repair protein MutL